MIMENFFNSSLAKKVATMKRNKSNTVLSEISDAERVVAELSEKEVDYHSLLKRVARLEKIVKGTKDCEINDG